MEPGRFLPLDSFEITELCKHVASAGDSLFMMLGALHFHVILHLTGLSPTRH